METISNIVILWQKLKSSTHSLKFLTRTMPYIVSILEQQIFAVLTSHVTNDIVSIQIVLRTTRCLASDCCQCDWGVLFNQSEGVFYPRLEI